jgi:hypothetical protein
MTETQPRKRRKNVLFAPLIAVTIYAGAITPMAYEAGRRHVVEWALNQPEADALVADGYTHGERDQIANALANMPALKPKK